MALRRRKTDLSSWPDWLVSGAKIAVGLLITGSMSFIGTWGVGVSSSIASLKENQIGMKEIQIGATERETFLSTWLMDEVKNSRKDVKELSKEIAELRKELRK